MYKSLIYNQIQFISRALPCYIIKPSLDFQIVNIRQGCKLNKGCRKKINYYEIITFRTVIIFRPLTGDSLGSKIITPS